MVQQGRAAHPPDGRERRCDLFRLHDGLHRLCRVTAGVQWGGGAGVTTYGLNSLGQVMTATLARGVTTTYGYDTAHRLTSITHQKGTLTLSQHSYTAAILIQSINFPVTSAQGL